MKRLKKKHLIMSFITCFILLGFVLISDTCYAAKAKNKKITVKNDSFYVDLEYGIGEVALYDLPLPIKVKVICNENFTGSIRLNVLKDDGRKNIAYGEKISLAAGEEKTFTFIPKSIQIDDYIQVDLLNKRDKVIYSEQSKLVLENIGSASRIGILSDDYPALNYFDGLILSVDNYNGMTSVVELSEESLFEDSNALTALSYIIVDNFDTTKLSDGQYQAIKEWVNNGGVLILALGPNYKRVMSKFTDNFITGNFEQMTKKDLIWNELTQLENVDVVPFKFDGAREMQQFSEDHSAYKKEIGKGNVVVLSYALGLEPMVSFEQKQLVASSLIEQAASQYTGKFLNGDIYNENFFDNEIRIAKLLNHANRPSVWLYGALLIIYVILVGPGIYLILKKINAREKLWFVIPVISMCFVFIIYLTGFIYRINKPIINTFSILSLNNGMEEEEVYANLVCPKAKTYTVELNNKYTSFDPETNNYDYGFFGTNRNKNLIDYTLMKTENGKEIIVNSKKTFSEQNFKMTKFQENDKGRIDYDLKCYTDRFEGTITNHTKYDLKNVIVNYETLFYIVGDLKKGEQAKIDSSKIIRSNGYGSLTIYTSDYDLDQTIYNEINERFEDSIMQGSQYTFNQGRIWAVMDGYTSNVANDSKIKTRGISVLMQRFEEKYQDVRGDYYSSLTPFIYRQDGEYDARNGFVYADTEVTYSFEDVPSISMLQNTSFNQKPTNGADDYAEVYMLNYETLNYDLVFRDKDTLEGEELKKYLHDGMIIVKYKLNGNVLASVPNIIAKGDE